MIPFQLNNLAASCRSLLLLLTIGVSVSVAQDEFDSALTQELQSLGVQPDTQGLKAYFASYSPDSSSSKRVKELIAQLGSDEFSERTIATSELAKVSLTDLPLVRQATKSEDLEISLRARQVIKMFEKGTHLRKLRRVLELMESHKIKGYVEELCVTLQVIRPDNLLRNQFERTMKISAVEKDSALIKQYVANRSLEHRDVYVRMLSAIQPGKHSELFSELVNEKESDEVVLAAATELAKIPDRRCLNPLIQLLENDSVRIRSRANQILRMVTGERFGFVAVANEESRQKAIKQWQSWNRKSGKDAVLVKDSLPQKTFLNRLIIGSYTRKKVYETDLNGKVLRTFENVGAPMGVCGSEDGTVLVCDYTGKQVLLFGPDAKVIFKKKLAAGPLDGELLENGNVLVGASNTKKVFEIDRDGKTVWEASVESRINVVHRTPDNTTLVSMLGAGKVVELNAAGKIIFEIEVHKPNGVRRLDNGNTLVCLYDKGEVHEYDPDKKLVWKATGLTKPARAQRMPDGNTIIYHREGVVVFNSAEEKVKKIPVKEIRSGDVGTVHFF